MLEKYHDWLHEKSKVATGQLEKVTLLPLVEKTLFEILNDFTGRRGLRHEWNRIDDDIKEEVLSEWLKIIEVNHEERVVKVLQIIARYGGIDELHHKQWLLDQVVRILTDCPTVEMSAQDYTGAEYTCNGLGESIEYKAWVAMRFGDEWDIGIAP